MSTLRVTNIENLNGETFFTSSNGQSVDFPGDVTVNSIAKTGGTSLEFLKADGSVDSTTYAIDSQISLVGKSGDYGDLLNKPDLSLLENFLSYADFASFPVTGETVKIYLAQDTGYIYRWDGTQYIQLTDQTAVWGSISGTLSNQTDLQNALDAKQNNITFNDGFNIFVGNPETAKYADPTSYSNIFLGAGAGQGLRNMVSSVTLTSSTAPAGASSAYYDVPSSGGTGTGARFNVFRNSTTKVVTGVVVATPYGSGGPKAAGSGYEIGDILTIDGANVGGVSGTDDITVTVTAVENTDNDQNIFIGSYSGYQNKGRQNVFLGSYVGQYNAANNNVFIGHEAGYCNIAGCTNVFIGLSAGRNATAGNFNILIGDDAGCKVNGAANNILGYLAGSWDTFTGSYNNLFGNKAGYKNTTGSHNNLIGNGPGSNNTSGSCNNFFGWYTGVGNTTGSDNNFFGRDAGSCNTTGNYNVFLGAHTGLSSTVSNKVIIGKGLNSSNLFDAPDITKDNQLAIGLRNSTDPANYWIVGNENFNVGFGINDPQTKVAIGGVLGFGTTGNVKIGDSNTGVNITTGADNTFIGAYAGNAVTSGGRNNYFGYCAGANNTTGSDNNFFGMYAGQCTTRSRNNFLGMYSGQNNQGDDNNFLGYQAGQYNTTGFHNTFIGYQSGRNNAGGDGNNFLGCCTGRNNTTGSYNNFFSALSGVFNQSGSYNNFFGFFAGFLNETGSYNNFLGRDSGCTNTTGNANNFFGFRAGRTNTTGGCNNSFGFCAGYCNTTGNYNSFFGSHTGISTSASNKIIIGRGHTNLNRFDSPNTTSDTQLAIGVRTSADPANYWIVGNENFNIGFGVNDPQTKVAIGGVLGFAGNNVRIGDNTTGNDFMGQYHNNLMGISAGSCITTGSYNNFFGYYAGYNNVGGSGNNFFGHYAGYNSVEGSDNNYLGREAGAGWNLPNIGWNNNFLGRNIAIFNTTGSYNNLFGSYVGHENTTGSHNNFFGTYAAQYNTTGSHNIAIGRSAGQLNTTGSGNISFGNEAGKSNISGNKNIFLGSYSGDSESASYKVIIGNGVNFSNTFDSPNTTDDTQLAIGVRTSTAPANYWIVGNENFNVGIGATDPVSKLTVGDGANGILGVDTTTTTIASTVATTIESFSATTYRSAKLQIQITQGTNYQVSDILIIHDGTTSTLIESATLSSNVLLSTFSTAIETGNVVVKTTMSTADSATVKVVSSKITA